ncbi:terbinafine resistance locus protein Yip1 (macronuclear) [Tetrahymena thermophila SB210]|uniref:Protein YIPF n=1 Tax=Tetrahymena thermophila (strain SB210) TaxID=312017 RepID=X1W3N6_TETTS|nr:terbinafine resistance locus protein Yip1 [Tetrahymena thermophila SB210]EAS02380.2 terbinafine resistance locus protein Yip1 [Tetrahymena thermophila SB210]|eukprot:XP_001022625.2 terbinafine resistance locus protein Yip1 [Tetrahymena thermophila SB210]
MTEAKLFNSNVLNKSNMDKFNPGKGFEQYADYFDTSPDAQYDTLDEPVSKTIGRDLKMIGHKLKYVLLPRFREETGKSLREWDLWGPLLFCLILSFVLTLSTTDNNNLFATIFLIIWGGSLIVTVNCNILGGNAHILQCLCVLGYCIFPIVLAAVILTAFSVIYQSMIIKASIVGFAFLWSSTSSVAFMSSIIDPDKKALSMYPIILFYLFLSWFCLFI